MTSIERRNVAVARVLERKALGSLVPDLDDVELERPSLACVHGDAHQLDFSHTAIRADVSESQGELLVTVDLPGLEKEQVRLRVYDSVLSIILSPVECPEKIPEEGKTPGMTPFDEKTSAEEKSAPTPKKRSPRFHQRERSFSAARTERMMRNIRLPRPVESGAAEASFQAGVMQIRFPILAREETKDVDRIPISA